MAKKRPRTSTVSSEYSRVTVYVPGTIPSLRDTESLLSSTQAAIVWSAIMRIPHPYSHSSGQLYPLSWSLRESFDRFLVSEYEPILSYGAASAGGRIEESEGNPRHPESLVARITQDFVQRRSLPHSPEEVSGEFGTLCRDLVDWSAEEFGRDAFEIERLDTGGSLEVVFYVAPVLAMLGLQDYEAAKEVIVYASDVVRGWIGKVRPNRIATPKLSKGMRDLFAQYDDVSLEANDAGGWTLRLVRDQQSKKPALGGTPKVVPPNE